MADVRVVEAAAPRKAFWEFSEVRADELEPPLYDTRVAGAGGFELVVGETRPEGNVLTRSLKFRFSPNAAWQRAIALFTMMEGYELKPDAGLALRDSDWSGTEAELRLLAEALRAFVTGQSNGQSDFKTLFVQWVNV